MAKGIFTAFRDRKQKAIVFSIEFLKLPVREIIDGKLVMRGQDFYVAKKILQIFADEATDTLLRLYETGDAVMKSNVIVASGNLPGQAIRTLLIEALDDKSLCPQEESEISEVPLRICDIAYNQLVLRYKIKNVLRTIGTVHKIEVRDYHINVLKSRL